MPVSAGRPFPGSEQQASGSSFTGPGKAIGSGGRAAHGRTSAEAYRKGGVVGGGVGMQAARKGVSERRNGCPRAYRESAG